jgi:dolichyl-phosphate beta-glucosyltransferase
MLQRPRLSVVIPAYNEETRLPATLARVVGYLAGKAELTPAEVIVVDDGSRDATASLAASVSTQGRVTVHVLRLGENRGKGAAVRSGLAASTGQLVLVSDADLAAPIEEVEALIASRADIAVGSRALRRELITRRQPIGRDLLGRLFNLALRMLRLTPLRDTQCGFKLIGGDLARRLAAVQRLDGFAFDVELLARAQRLGATVAEVPVHWAHVDDSRVRPVRHGARMVIDALRVRWWLLTGG